MGCVPLIFVGGACSEKLSETKRISAKNYALILLNWACGSNPELAQIPINDVI